MPRLSDILREEDTEVTDVGDAPDIGPEPIDGIFVDVARAEIVPPSWIVENMLPPGLTFLAGPPKSMKSTITAALAALVAEYSCDALPENLSVTHRHGPVLWLSAEALAGEIRHMMETGLGIGRMEPREAILVAETPWEFRLDDRDALDKLLSWLKRRDPRLVIIDPLRDFHHLEERDAGGMNRLLRPIRQWAVEHDSAVMIVHHTKKLSDDLRDSNYSAQDMRGTTALFGIADGVLMLTPKKDGIIHVSATFKRAKGWEKEITLQAYGSTPAVDKLSNLEAQVAILMASDVTDLREISERLHVGLDAVYGAVGRLSQQKQQAVEAAKKGKSWTTKR
jgi:hypothetical protein